MSIRITIAILAFAITALPAQDVESVKNTGRLTDGIGGSRSRQTLDIPSQTKTLASSATAASDIALRDAESATSLHCKDRGEFIANILDGLPQAPQYFGHNAALNREGPPLVDWNPKELFFLEPVDALSNINQYYVADIRDAEAYAAGHIPNSVKIGIRGRFETWVGILVPWGAKLIVSGDNDDELREAIHRLHRVGYQPECIKFETRKSASLSLAQNETADPSELYAAMQTAESPVIVGFMLRLASGGGSSDGSIF